MHHVVSILFVVFAPTARGRHRCQVVLGSACFLAGSQAGCGRQEGPNTDHRHRAVVTSVDSATRAFESAQRALDPERVVAHLAPGFYMHADGQRIGYDSVVLNIRRDFSAVRHVEPGFRDVDILVLGPEAALASFRYRDSVVAADGAVRRVRGATTLAWMRRGADWRIVYAHADHQEDRPH